jgi:hypothetical protein
VSVPGLLFELSNSWLVQLGGRRLQPLVIDEPLGIDLLSRGSTSILEKNASTNGPLYQSVFFAPYEMITVLAECWLRR